MTVETIINRLCKAGHQVFVVGGFVRDELLGRNCHDEDIVTSARPAEIIQLFRDKNVNLVGATFGVVIVDGVEIATFRTDDYQNPGEAEVTLVSSVEDDLSRRDLTINSLALCPITGDIVDLFGGRDDLENRVIRFVGNPVDRIKEDPVRIIRAARFKAKINGTFHCDTLRALRDHAHWIRKFVAPERIRLEVIKGLEIPKASRFIQALEEIGALPFIFPSVQACVGFDGGDHHAETVFEHLCGAADSIHPKHSLVRIAALLHDVGKPAVWDGEHFLDHENVGAAIAKRELQNLRFSVDEVEFIVGLIRVHMNLVNGLTGRATRRLLKRLADNNVSLNDFIRLKISDRVSNKAKPNQPFANLVKLVRTLRANLAVPTKTNQLAINGFDVQRILNIGPDKQVGVVLNELLEFVVENGEEFNNTETLTAFVLRTFG